MRSSIAICIAVFIALVWLLRRKGTSLGLPVAYLANLLVLHVPGAVAQYLDRARTLTPPQYTRTGIILTAIGSVAFLIGVAFTHAGQRPPRPTPAPRTVFWRYCVFAGGICTVVGYLINIPSIGAILSRGGAIWMLGILLGLRVSVGRGDRAKAIRWIAVLAAYPILMLLLGGFLSYGSVAVIIVLSGLAITARSPFKLAMASVVLLVLGMSLFLSYFQHRPEIRAAVWGGADTDARIDAAVSAMKDVKLFDPTREAHLYALDQRLNQNYFVGLAQARIDAKQVDYLYGRSLYEGLQSLIPRALWPDKPVVAGSPKIVGEMTGLVLSETTSFGVGNVMEFDINFGMPGVIIGFLVLGVALGVLDRKAAEADISGRLGDTLMFFLPAVALIQPNGSLVEIMSGAAAALAAAFAWRWGWDRVPKRVVRRPTVAMDGPEPVSS